MTEPYLQVTYRHGQILAAYLYLPRKSLDKSCRVEELAPGLLADFRADGQPIGIEITSPRKLSLQSMNEALEKLGMQHVTEEDLRPILAA